MTRRVADLDTARHTDIDFGRTQIALHVESSVPATINFFGASDQGGLADIRTGPNNPDLTPGIDKELFALTTQAAGFHREGLQLIYRNPNRAISILAHLRADDATNRCQLHGTAIPAG